MKNILLAGVATLAIAGSTVVYAQQHRPWVHEHMRMSPGGQGGLCRRPDRGRPCRVEAHARSGKAVAAGRGCGAGFRKNADRSRQCANGCAVGRFQGCAEAGRSGGAAAPARRQHGDIGGGAEEDRRCRRSALQDLGRRPEAPARGPDSHGAPLRRRLATPRARQNRDGGWDRDSGRGEDRGDRSGPERL